MPKEQREWRIEGRERADWDAALLAQVVLATARARVGKRQAATSNGKAAKPAGTESTR